MVAKSTNTYFLWGKDGNFKVDKLIECKMVHLLAWQPFPIFY